MKHELLFITHLSIAASNCSLYSKDHSMTEQSIGRALGALEKLSVDRLEIMLVEGDLVLNKEACREAGLHGNSMIRRLERRGISRVDFIKGLSAAEMKTFLSALLHQSADISSTPHLKVGAISIRTMGAEGDPSGGGAFLQQLTYPCLHSAGLELLHAFDDIAAKAVVALLGIHLDGIAEILEGYGKGSGHVFNLGHGIHPAIPPEHAGAMIEAVHELSRPYHT